MAKTRNREPLELKNGGAGVTSPIETASSASRIWAQSEFWDGVEVEIEVLDLADFLEFLDAGDLDFDGSPGFRSALRTRLRGLVRRRFAH